MSYYNRRIIFNLPDDQVDVKPLYMGKSWYHTRYGGFTNEGEDIEYIMCNEAYKDLIDRDCKGNIAADK